MVSQSVVCPECGLVSDIEPGVHSFCRQCDYPLFWVAPRSRVSMPQPAAPADRGPIIVCSVCGAENTAARTFCESCGTGLRPVMRRRPRIWEAPQPPERKPSRRRRIALAALGIIVAVLLVALVIGLAAYILWPRAEWRIQTLDEGEASWDISMAIGPDQAPFIAYVDAANQELRTLKCVAPDCDGAHLGLAQAPVAAPGQRGQGHGTAVAYSREGLAIVVYRDGQSQSLMIALCADAACNQKRLSTLEGGSAGLTQPSLAIGSDGFPIVAYHDSVRGSLKIAHCQDRDCQQVSVVTLDRQTTEGRGLGMDNVIAIGPDGLPIVLFRDEDARALKLARCTDISCARASVVVLVQAPGLQPGHDNTMILGPDGLPVIAYTEWSASDGGIYLIRCQDASCSARSRVKVDDESGEAAEPSVALDDRGRPIVTYRAKETGDERGRRQLRLVQCLDQSCTRRDAAITIDQRGRVGYASTVARLPSGHLAIVYGDATGGALKFAYLGNAKTPLDRLREFIPQE